MQLSSQSPSAQLAERPYCKRLATYAMTWGLARNMKIFDIYSACVRADDRKRLASCFATRESHREDHCGWLDGQQGRIEN
jgi:hypothetical protein